MLIYGSVGENGLTPLRHCWGKVGNADFSPREMSFCVVMGATGISILISRKTGIATAIYFHLPWNDNLIIADMAFDIHYLVTGAANTTKNFRRIKNDLILQD